ncbi:TetR family transcriptional regulator [Arthrobacter sp. UCD-GKA]|uniref:TetR/AcrR family transcriptional regulator n=1 Tax=Arthrobacter sp. UCD-GKA TaxID=1913576 RepID=UPI0008DD7B98|nr:TetR/AcrR family transcriptional regulator [Arthrobacter sp. UCD-GKA]OIH85233.1 TetR family transcriptional regulator [Arthrobacter sp. UCD-GKA]
MGRERDILRAAADTFYEKGFHGVSVDELGKRAGLSGPALYRSFSGKDEILSTLLNEALDELMSATIPVHDDPAKDLERAIRHHVDFALRQGPMVGIYQREVRSLVDPWKRAFYHRRQLYSDRWEELFLRRYPHLDAATAAIATQSTLGTIFSIPHWPGRMRNSATILEQTLALLAHGHQALEPIKNIAVT